MAIMGKLLRTLGQTALKTGNIGLKRQLIGWREGVSQVEEMATAKGIRKDIICALQEVPLRNRLLHDVYQRSTERPDDEVDIHRIREVDFRGSLFIIAEHGDHWHVVHDCVEHIINCIKYLRSRVRQIRYFQIGQTATGRRLYNKIRGLPVEAMREDQSGKVVEGGKHPTDLCSFLECTGGDSSGGPTKSHRDSDKARSKTTVTGRKGDRFMAFLREHPCAPIQNLFSTRHWTNGPFKYEPKSSPLLR